MRKGLLGGFPALLLGASLASAQVLGLPELAPAQPDPATSPPVANFDFCTSGCTRCPQAWLAADYLLWWIRSAPNPVPLVTTGPYNPNSFTGSPIPAALGSPGTQVLFGDRDVGFHGLSGARLYGGLPLSSDGLWSLEGGAFLLEQAINRFGIQSDAAGNPFLAFPFRNALSGSEGVNPISFPSDSAHVLGGQAGGINASTSSRLWGSEANLALNLYSDSRLRVTGLIGFRYLDLDETMALGAQYTPLFVSIPFNAPLPTANPGDQVILSDNFHTRDQFYGGQVGARANYSFGPLVLEITAKVAFGSTQEFVDINGSTTVLPAGGGAPTTVPGGIYTTLSNIGTYHHSVFAVVPDIGLNVSRQLTEHLRAKVGYSFMYWSSVVRPGTTVDRTLDQAGIPTSPAYIPGSIGSRPLPQFEQSGFWAQGLNLGLEFTF
jgi:hypothetical protein